MHGLVVEVGAGCTMLLGIGMLVLFVPELRLLWEEVGGWRPEHVVLRWTLHGLQRTVTV